VNGLTEVKINSAEDDVEYASRNGSREPSPERNDNNNNIDDVNDNLSVDPNPSLSTTASRQTHNSQNKNQDTTIINIPDLTGTMNISIPSTPSRSNNIIPSGQIGVDANGNQTLTA
jgi:hypothetical protein